MIETLRIANPPRPALKSGSTLKTFRRADGTTGYLLDGKMISRADGERLERARKRKRTRTTMIKKKKATRRKASPKKATRRKTTRRRTVKAAARRPAAAAPKRRRKRRTTALAAAPKRRRRHVVRAAAPKRRRRVRRNPGTGAMMGVFKEALPIFGVTLATRAVSKVLSDVLGTPGSSGLLKSVTSSTALTTALKLLPAGVGMAGVVLLPKVIRNPKTAGVARLAAALAVYENVLQVASAYLPTSVSQYVALSGDGVGGYLPGMQPSEAGIGAYLPEMASDDAGIGYLPAATTVGRSPFGKAGWQSN